MVEVVNMNVYKEMEMNVKVLLHLITNVPNEFFVDEFLNDKFYPWTESIDPCCIIYHLMKESIQLEGVDKIYTDYIENFFEDERGNSFYFNGKCYGVSENIFEKIKLEFNLYCKENNIAINSGMDELNNFVAMLLFMLLKKFNCNSFSNKDDVFLEQHLKPMVNLFVNKLESRVGTNYCLGIACLLSNLMMQVKVLTRA